MTKLGGNNKPTLPDAVTNPKEKRSSYLSDNNAGISSPPKATIVTLEAPVNAVNIAHAISVTIAKPPGIQPKAAPESLTNLLDALDFAKI